MRTYKFTGFWKKRPRLSTASVKSKIRTVKRTRFDWKTRAVLRSTLKWLLIKNCFVLNMLIRIKWTSVTLRLWFLCTLNALSKKCPKKCSKKCLEICCNREKNNDINEWNELLCRNSEKNSNFWNDDEGNVGFFDFVRTYESEPVGLVGSSIASPLSVTPRKRNTSTVLPSPYAARITVPTYAHSKKATQLIRTINF